MGTIRSLEPGYHDLGRVTEFFHATRHLAEWRRGGSGGVKQICIWKVRPELCGVPGATGLLMEDLGQAAELAPGQATQILNLWLDGDRVAYATEHVSGMTLADVSFRLTARGSKLPVPAVLSILLEVARTLQLAHEVQGTGGPLIHGDLRPEWVILGYDGRVRLTGFGLGRFLPHACPDGAWARQGGRCYQPPERLGAIGAVDGRIDVYALGALLLEAVTGELPYGVRDPAKLRDLLQGESGSLPSAAQRAPQDLAGVIARACALEPARRYESVEALAGDLHGLLLDLAVPDARPALVRQALGAVSPQVVQDPSVRRRISPESLTCEVEIKPGRRPSAPSIERRGGFVGRAAALRALGQALAETAQGRGQALLIEGEQGMGRTQLLAEARGRLHDAGHRVAWLKVAAHPAEQDASYSALLRLLTSAAGLRPGPSHTALTGKIDRLRAFGLDANTRAALAGVLGAREVRAPDPDQVSGLMSQALIRCVSSLSWEQPTVVAWDDLQWTDPASLRCLEDLLDQVALLPVVVLLTAPPSFEVSWTAEPPIKLTLGPLTRAECLQLVRARVPDASAVDEALLDLLERHTGGNPLLIEEILELLRQGEQLDLDDEGLLRLHAGAAPLPDFNGVVQARLESLDPKHYVVLVAAALAGPALSVPVVAKTAGMPLAATQQILESLTGEQGLLRETSGDDLAFSHERLRLAVLAGAERPTLVRLSKRVARTISNAGAELSCGVADHVAGLHELAGDPVAAARLLEATASRQEGRGDLRGAAERYDRALGLARGAGALDEGGVLALQMKVGRAAMQGLRLKLGRAALEEAVVLADRLEDLLAGAEARVLLSRLLSRQGRLDEAMDLAREAVPLAERAGDRSMLARAYAAIAESYQQRGTYGPDMEFVAAAIAAATEVGDTLRVGEYLQLAVMHASAVGRFDETWQYLQRARDIAAAADDPVLTCQLLRLEGALLLTMGDSEGSLQTNLRGVARAREHGLAEAEIVMLHNAGDSHLHLDNMREALYCFSESLRRSKAIRFDRLVEANEMYLGFLEAAHLGAQSGFERLRRAIATEERVGRLWNLNQGHQLLGRALLARGDHAGALEHLKEALRLAERTGVRYFIDEANLWLERAGASAE